MTQEEKKAIERIEDFLTSNIIVSISNDECADSEELRVDISKNEFIAIEYIASKFIEQATIIKELEELKVKHNVRINVLCAMVDAFAYYSIPKSLVKEKIIQDKANLNKSVNANLKKLYKARIEFGQELLGD